MEYLQQFQGNYPKMVILQFKRVWGGNRKTRDANVYLTNDLEELFKRYLPPDTDI